MDGKFSEYESTNSQAKDEDEIARKADEFLKEAVVQVAKYSVSKAVDWVFSDKSYDKEIQEASDVRRVMADRILRGSSITLDDVRAERGEGRRFPRNWRREGWEDL
jgi:hypothetical protein